MNTNVFFKVHSIGHLSPDVYRGYGLVSEVKSVGVCMRRKIRLVVTKQRISEQEGGVKI